MSYDLSLVDRVSRKTVDLPFAHVMTGGTFKADFTPNTGGFSPAPTTEAWLNITYNYSGYYYQASDGHEEFMIDGDNKGIWALNGKTGLESIKMLDILIEGIKTRYPGLETDPNYWESCPGNAIRPLYQLKTMAQLRPDAIWEVE